MQGLRVAPLKLVLGNYRVGRDYTWQEARTVLVRWPLQPFRRTRRIGRWEVLQGGAR